MPTEIDNVMQAITDAKLYFKEHFDKGIEPVKGEVDKLTKAVQEAQSAVKVLQSEKAARIAEDGKLKVRSGRLAGFDLFSLRLAEVMAGSLYVRSDQSKGGKLLNEIREQRKNLFQFITTDKIMEWEDNQLRRLAVNSKDGMFGQAMRSKISDLSRWREQLIAEHTKAMDSTTAAKGDELVPTFESAELWMDMNLDTIVLPLLQQTPMPTNPYDIPIQLGDTNWYPSTENVQVTTTDLSTQKVTLTAYGIKTGVPFSDELEEDAIIAFVPELRAGLVRNASEVIDDILLNADTTVTNGINSDGATISKSTAGKGHWLLGFDGLIHQALVDNSSNQSIDKAAAIDADIFNRLLTKMGKYALPRRRGDVVYISDVPTSVRALSITEFETVDVAGERATLSTGELMNVSGRPYVAADEMRQADVDGKVTDSGNVTPTLGRILAVNTTQWRVGFRRQVTVETAREAGKGQTTMYVSLRMALTERSGTRSTAKHTAVAFNITGVS